MTVLISKLTCLYLSTGITYIYRLLKLTLLSSEEVLLNEVFQAHPQSREKPNAPTFNRRFVLQVNFHEDWFSSAFIQWSWNPVQSRSGDSMSGSCSSTGLNVPHPTLLYPTGKAWHRQLNFPQCMGLNRVPRRAWSVFSAVSWSVHYTLAWVYL